jgi:glyoxylate carboligase
MTGYRDDAERNSEAMAGGYYHCYGVGEALNPVISAMRRNGSIDFVHVRHGEYGVFAQVAEAAGPFLRLATISCPA